MDKLKVLLLSANPTNTDRLRVTAEFKEIEACWLKAMLRDHFVRPVSIGSIGIDDLQRILIGEKPHVVHFAGHGAGKDGIVLETDAGEWELADTEALADLFRILQNDGIGIQCVVLNACFSKVQAEAIARYVPYVIGMSQTINDNAAIEFSKGFYTGLFEEKTFNDAFDLGKNQIEFKKFPSSQVPMLFSLTDQFLSGVNLEIEKCDDLCKQNWVEHNELEAMIAELKLAKLMSDPNIFEKVPNDLKNKSLGRLREVFNDIRERNRLEGHVNGVKSVAFSLDGQMLASGSDDTIKLWNLEGKELLTINGDDLHGLAFNGTVIASGSGKTIKLWNLEGKELLTINGHSDLVRSVAIYPDVTSRVSSINTSTMLASASDDDTIKLWDLEGKELFVIKGHSGERVRCITFSPNGTMIASMTLFNIKLRNLKGKELCTIQDQEHFHSFCCLAFSPDSKMIASGGCNYTLEMGSSVKTSPMIKLWDLKGKECLTINGHSDVIWSMAFSPDGKIIASGGNDNIIKLWDMQGRELWTLNGHRNRINSLAFSSDREMPTLASSSNDDTIKLWNLKSPERLTINTNMNSSENCLGFSDAKIATVDVHTINLWDLKGKELITITTNNSGEYFKCVAFSPDGKMIASGSSKRIKLWNLEGKELCNLKSHTRESEAFSYVAFSPNGKILVSGGNTIKLWSLGNVSNIRSQPLESFLYKVLQSIISNFVETPSLEGIEMLKISNSSGTCVAFSSDGKMIASGSYDKTIKLWNLEGKLLHTLKGHGDSIICVAFSANPDDKMLASGSHDRTIKLWNLEGKLLHTIKGHSAGVSCVAFSPNYKIIASSSYDKTIKLWDLDGRELRTIKGHSEGVDSIAFSSDGKMLASKSSDNTIKLWDLHWDFDCAHYTRKACNWLSPYLANNPNVSDNDRHLCDFL